MKKNEKLICLAVAVVLSIAGLLSVLLTGGFRPSVETDGETILVATAPYDYDIDSIDRDLLHEKLSSLIKSSFTVGVTRNYSHGYPEILIISPDHFDVSADEVKAALNETYPDLGIEAVDHFNYTSTRSKSRYYVTALLVTASAFVAVALYFVITRRAGYSLKWLAAAVLSLLSVLLFEKIVGCREGNTVMLFTVLSLAASTAVVINAAANSDNAEQLAASNKKFAVTALIYAAVVLAVCAGAGSLAGLPDCLNIVLTAAAAVIPSLAVSALVVSVLL